MAEHMFYHVQYEKRFADEIVAAPQFMRDEFVEMCADLQANPKYGDRYQVFPSKERPGAYHMLFNKLLAWIVYTVADEPVRKVQVFRLVNARDLL